MQPDISKRACLCLAMKQKESKSYPSSFGQGPPMPHPPSARAQVADSLPWCRRAASLCGGGSLTPWLGPQALCSGCPPPARCRWHPAGTSKYQHTPLGTISSPLESPQNWGPALPQAGSNLETRLGSRRVWGRVAHYETVHQQRQPSSLLALENALQHPNPAVLQAPADGPANCQHATASAPCVVLQRAILMAASNEQNWCVFVLFPFK